jgi:hypothetical protein
MNMSEMHYHFKRKINKIDSQKRRNFVVPEIDTFINEAIYFFVKMVAFPRVRGHYSFEKTQRSIDDVRTLVTKATLLSNGRKTYALPVNYWHYLSGEMIASKGNCKLKKLTVQIKQHDDTFEKSPFDKSSFEWGEVNALFVGNNLEIFLEDAVQINEIIVRYLKLPTKVHNAAAFTNNTYTDLRGNVLTGVVNCELPEHTHEEIVDIAVALASGDLSNEDYGNKLNKIKFNNYGS